jgi:small ligand-binding sensory domain FIST
MRFGVGFSVDQDSRAAAAASAAQAASALGGTRPDLAMVFVSPHHAGNWEALRQAIRSAADPVHLLGCTGESIIAGAREFEDSPAVAVWLASLPSVDVRTFALEFENTPEGPAFLGLPDDLPAAPAEGSAAFLMLGDPFTFPMDGLLERLNDEFPGRPVIGGMASAADRPGDNRLFLGDQELPAGAVGAYLSGRFRLRSVVSQGCRPIGRPLVITKADGAVIHTLGGKPAWEQLRAILEELPPADAALLRNGHNLFVGRVINEYQDAFRRGDFLIRNFRGYDPDSGAVAVMDEFRTGQTIQFHLRDAAAADEELRELLGAAGPASGALLFTCNGRGSRMFNTPDHDAAVLAEKVGPVPAAGFFCAGELGPVGGRNFMHGFTASVALFAEA